MARAEGVGRVADHSAAQANPAQTTTQPGVGKPTVALNFTAMVGDSLPIQQGAQIVAQVPVEQAAQIVASMPAQQRAQIVAQVPVAQAAQIVLQLPPQAAVQILVQLASVSPKEAASLLLVMVQNSINPKQLVQLLILLLHQELPGNIQKLVQQLLAKLEAALDQCRGGRLDKLDDATLAALLASCASEELSDVDLKRIKRKQLEALQKEEERAAAVNQTHHNLSLIDEKLAILFAYREHKKRTLA